MTQDTKSKLTQREHLVYDDPIFAALAAEREASRAFGEALNALTRVGAFSVEPPTEALIALQLDCLADLEAAEATASAALMEAERTVLTTRPTTLSGAAALLAFLRRHLNEDPDIQPVIDAIAHIEALLGGVAFTAIDASTLNFMPLPVSDQPGMQA